MFNPFNPDTDAKKKNGGIRILDIPAYLVPYLDNDFVKDIRGKKIIYRPEFYVAMYKRIHDENMNYVEAYESLGFDCKVLGQMRAEQAGRDTMEKARQNKRFTTDSENYDGSVPLEKLPPLTQEEMFAYVMKRVAYLETVVEAQKMIQSILDERFNR